LAHALKHLALDQHYASANASHLFQSSGFWHGVDRLALAVLVIVLGRWASGHSASGTVGSHNLFVVLQQPLDHVLWKGHVRVNEKNVGAAFGHGRVGANHDEAVRVQLFVQIVQLWWHQSRGSDHELGQAGTRIGHHVGLVGELC
ncbi:MAG: hypothetical protein AN485_24350, partial [Anabaena sp. MDT14b]